MTRRAWLLFAAMSVIWGIPYLFIKIAVVELSPVTIAGLRTLLGAAVLLPLAARAGAIRPAIAAWPYVVAFGLMEMAVPWVLLGHAEQRVPSGFAGLMLAVVPLVGTLVSWLLGERHALTRVRLPLTVGTIIGFPLVLLGSYWATRAPQPAAAPVETVTGSAASGTC